MSAVNRMRYFCTDAWEAWRHSIGVNLLALGTLTAALFLAGLVTLVLSNVEREVRGQHDRVRIAVYLTDGHDEAAREALQEELQAIPGVARVTYVDKQEALRRYREFAADMAELVRELDDNPLPASLEVGLRPGAPADVTAHDISEKLAERPEVEEVRFDREWLERLDGLMRVARNGSVAVAVLVFAAVGFVIASVLRLAVYSRRDEIDIMRLVGATPGFIRGPFLVAGFVQGLLASGVAWLLVELVRRVAVGYASSKSVAVVDLVTARPLSLELTLALGAVGLVVSLAGSWIAVRQGAR